MFFKKTRFDQSKIPGWRFREMHSGEMNVDPIEGEFFNTEAISSMTGEQILQLLQGEFDRWRQP